MQEFIVALEPRAGTLAEVLRVLAKENVNIMSAMGQNVGDFDTFRFEPDKPEKAEAALRRAYISHRTSEIVNAIVPNRPGELLKVAEKLGAAGINIEAFYLLSADASKAEVAFRVKDASAARKALAAVAAATPL